jgi:hypothetical protein
VKGKNEEKKEEKKKKKKRREITYILFSVFTISSRE